MEFVGYISSEMSNVGYAIKKRLKQREDMFLRRLFGMLAKMAKVDGKVDALDSNRKAREM